MQRREFIILLGSAALGGAAATWPLSVYGQQPDKMRRIGVLMAHAESDREGQAFVAAFLRGSRTSGGQRAKSSWRNSNANFNRDP